MTKTSFAYRGSVVFGLLACCMFGCGLSAPRADDARRTARTVVLARPCPQMAEAHAGHQGPFPRVFVEAADVTDVDLTAIESAGSAAYAMDADVVQVAGALIDNESRAKVPWPSYGRDAPSKHRGRIGEWSLELTPHLPEKASDVIRFSGLRISSGDERSTDAAGLRIATHDQRLTIVEVPRPKGAETLRIAITPYLVGSDAELHTLLECKKRARRASWIGTLLPRRAHAAALCS